MKGKRKGTKFRRLIVTPHRQASPFFHPVKHRAKQYDPKQGKKKRPQMQQPERRKGTKP
jgi:hypothetical protein